MSVEDFVFSCVLINEIEVEIDHRRLRIKDSRGKIERAIFHKEIIQREMIEAGLAEGIQFRGLLVYLFVC